MSIKIRFYLIVFSIVIGFLNPLLAQQDGTSTDKLYKFELKGGSEIIGSIVSEDSESLEVRTLSGLMMSIPKDEIISRKELHGDVVGERYLRVDPNSTRLLFASTARPLKPGTGYFAVYELIFAFAAYGLGDYITLAGGMTLMPGAPSQIFYLAPKITPFQADKFDLAVGVLHFFPPSWSDNGSEPATPDSNETDENEGLGIVYTNGTYGSQYAAVTVGLGWVYSGEDVTDSPILMLGGELQISKSIKLLTENWFPPEANIALMSLGVRFFGERLSADLGFLAPLGIGGGFFAIPWVSFVYNFGQ